MYNQNLSPFNIPTNLTSSVNNQRINPLQQDIVNVAEIISDGVNEKISTCKKNTFETIHLLIAVFTSIFIIVIVLFGFLISQNLDVVKTLSLQSQQSKIVYVDVIKEVVKEVEVIKEVVKEVEVIKEFNPLDSKYTLTKIVTKRNKICKYWRKITHNENGSQEFYFTTCK